MYVLRSNRKTLSTPLDCQFAAKICFYDLKFRKGLFSFQRNMNVPLPARIHATFVGWFLKKITKFKIGKFNIFAASWQSKKVRLINTSYTRNRSPCHHAVSAAFIHLQHVRSLLHTASAFAHELQGIDKYAKIRESHFNNSSVVEGFLLSSVGLRVAKFKLLFDISYFLYSWQIDVQLTLA